MRIIFFGTPEFAVASLQALVEAKLEVVAVVTAPDKPAGRGQKIHQSAVKEFAIANNLTVLQPTNLKDEAFIQEIQELPADAFTPRGSTALLDAIGKSIHLIESEFGKAIQNDEMSVVTIIITDGEENCTQFLRYEDIAKQIKEREETSKWTFSFIGCDFDALEISERLNIRRENVRNFEKRNYGIIMIYIKSKICSIIILPSICISFSNTSKVII